MALRCVRRRARAGSALRWDVELRSDLASWAIDQALRRVGFDYLQARPPVDCADPYIIRVVLSYCNTSLHRGTIYRAAGFKLARCNAQGIETWYTSAVAPLTAEQDCAIRQQAALPVAKRTPYP